MDDLFGYMGPTPTPTLPNPEVSDFAITQFHNSYFDTVHQVLPMINQSRFVNNTSKPELNALKYAVAMAGATAHEDGIEAAELCYNLARSNLEQAERGDNDEPFMTIAAVQSLVLIVYYELKKKTFTRTWMSVGRCMRLAKALELDHMDRDTELDDTPKSILATCDLASTSDLTELEERRNTFWCAYIIDSYTTTFLPIGSSEDMQDSRLRVRDVTIELTCFEDLTPFRGLAISAALASLESIHRQAAQNPNSPRNNAINSSYHFWNEHFRLSHIISSISNELVTPDPEMKSTPDVRTLFLVINVHAITIRLHELAIERSEWDGERIVPMALFSESHSCVYRAAMAVVSALRAAKLLDSKSTVIFRQMSAFAMLALSGVAKVLTRTLTLSQDPAIAQETIDGLHVLESVILELYGDCASFGTLLKDVGAQLAMYT
ncbi:hypothetical protein DPSP01_014278 [Paraphaeosphaeria sporulosa]